MIRIIGTAKSVTNPVSPMEHNVGVETEVRDEESELIIFVPFSDAVIKLGRNVSALVPS